MEFYELIQKRYSCRAYRGEPVDEAKLSRILEAARLAPTAANRQPFRLIVASTAGREAELAQVYNRDWLCQAPLILCACGLREAAWERGDGRNYLDVDIAIVVDHLVLAAAYEGLGTCWVAAFNRDAARGFFKLPEQVEPIILTPLGYPNDEPRPKERKPMEQLVNFDYWGGTKPV
jgi:nitroreductase